MNDSMPRMMGVDTFSLPDGLLQGSESPVFLFLRTVLFQRNEMLEDTEYVCKIRALCNSVIEG